MFKIIRLKNSKYPICPECGKRSIVLFTPPNEPIDFKKLGKDTYVNWDKAHLYCCNGSTNCKFSTRIKDLTTPLTERM